MSAKQDTRNFPVHVECFKTSDGSSFPTHKEALAHQTTLWMKEEEEVRTEQLVQEFNSYMAKPATLRSGLPATATFKNFLEHLAKTWGPL